MLEQYGINRGKLVDLAILEGTEFNDGIKGIGPKKALKLVRDFGSIENMPAEIRDGAGAEVSEIRDIFLHPEVTDNYSVTFASPDREGIIRFLCDERSSRRNA
jgi:flap endonuclease-1